MEFSEEAAATSSIANLSNDSESVLPVLPLEIIHEILLILPVKALLKMRCVSKSWLSLISSPQFIKTHLKFSTKKQDLRLLFSGSPENNSHRFYTCSLYAIMYQESLHQPIELDLSCKDYHMVEGSCDGLLCLSVGREELYLWNPSIRKLKRLAWSGKNNLHYTTYGFGYNESQDDYKVVKVDGSRRAYGFRGFEHVNNVSIYSLRTNSWKSILEKFPGVFFCRDPAKFVNGKLHWTKVVSVPYFATSEYAIRPIFISQNDDILMQYSTQNALKHSEIQIHDDSGVQFNLYIESLVSPNFVEEV
ncbi:F-box/kelch-repeat protein At3g23880-like [Nicotiana tomentosiformis]|uniref:F-box/kelch-repeat protein At3g23880-like n=1 Tax=Nicotiana tomentosiformis TaxID=4098 RepID=UPI00087881A9